MVLPGGVRLILHSEIYAPHKGSKKSEAYCGRVTPLSTRPRASVLLLQDRVHHEQVGSDRVVLNAASIYPQASWQKDNRGHRDAHSYLRTRAHAYKGVDSGVNILLL